MRILVAEDERDLAKLIKTVLEANYYTVDLVYDGLEAYSHIRVTPYDCLILDIMMPKMNGVSLLKKIRSEGNQTKVIFLTAKADVSDIVSGLDSGADDYLTKPFNFDELLARLRVVTRSSGDTAILSLGNVTLNRKTYVLKALSSVTLTKKEFQIMELLLLKQNEYLTSTDILDKLWEFDSEVDLNIVFVYISYLRKKLKDIGANIKIVASRNLGYVVKIDDQELA